MPTLPNMGLITPTLGGDSGQWDDKINACLGQIDAHDHTSGKGVQVPSAGININADLAWGGYALTALGKLAFSAVAALSSGSKTLFVSSADNELYWRTNAGTNVKLTNGASINTTLVGGIVGDYSSVGAEVAFDDTNKRYTFKDGSSPSKKWTRLASGPVRIFEYNTTESVYVELAVDAALAASYTVTLPAALPGSQTAVQIAASGALVYSNTFTGALTATDYKISTDRTLTLSAGAFNVHENATGTPPAAWILLSPTAAGTYYWSMGNHTAAYLVANLELKVGDQITGFTGNFNKGSDNTSTLKLVLKKIDVTNGTVTDINTQSTTATGLWPASSGALTETIAAGFSYILFVTTTDGTPSSTDLFYGCSVTYKRP